MRDLRRLLRWASRHAALLITTLLLQLTATLSLGLGIALLVPAAAALFGATDVALPAPLATLLPVDPSPTAWLLWVILLIVARNVLVALAALTAARCVRDLVLALREDTAEQLLHLPMLTLESSGIGDLTQRANGEIHRVAQATKDLVRMLAQGGAVAVFTVGMLLLSWRLSLLLLGTLAMLLPVWRWLGSSAERSGRNLSLASRRYARSLQEVLWSQRVIRDVDAVSRERQRLAEDARLREEAALRSSAISALVAPLTEITVVVAVAMLLAGAARYAGDATPSQTVAIVTVLALLSRWLPAAASVAAAWGQLSENLGAVRSVAELLSWPRAPNAGTVSRERAEALRLEGVCFRYPEAARPALTEVDLAVARGEIVAVVGASGAGKSTLAALVAGHLEPSAGELAVDNLPLRQLDRPSLSRIVHVLPQDAVLFDGSLADNIIYPAAEGPSAAIQHAAEAAGLNSLLERTGAEHDAPAFEAAVGERGSRLSGGERQRVALARAFYRAPSFLVLDEATSAVDEATEREIARCLRSHRERWGCLVIAHRPSSVLIADRIVVLRQGRVVGSGRHDELIAACDEYRRLYLESGDGASEDGASRDGVSAAARASAHSSP
ncbi:MAG: ABC transporter ATP-binding protein [Acidobacteriota bacterium]